MVHRQRPQTAGARIVDEDAAQGVMYLPGYRHVLSDSYSCQLLPCHTRLETLQHEPKN
jgi:hypothetical protein